ncbi:MAG: hypothetical protein HWE24_06995 [Oceanospirillaceae bacterium]|nr:hypothetical protein [Oceanospirillaceae bacterium]
MKTHTEKLHIRYIQNGKVMNFEEAFELEWIDKGTALLRESSDFLDDFWLLYGDTLRLEPLGNGYRVINIDTHSDMRHYQFGAPPLPKPLTDELLKLGGSWECDMGYLMTLHVPKRSKNEVVKLLNLNFEELEEVFSGLQK